MKNFIQPGLTITIPAAADVVSGQCIVAGSIFGVAAGDAQTGQPMDVVTVGVFDLPKVAVDDIANGDAVYFDEATELVTVTATDNVKIGVAVTAAASGAATVHVRLNGSF